MPAHISPVCIMSWSLTFSGSLTPSSRPSLPYFFLIYMDAKYSSSTSFSHFQLFCFPNTIPTLINNNLSFSLEAQCFNPWTARVILQYLWISWNIHVKIRWKQLQTLVPWKMALIREDVTVLQDLEIMLERCTLSFNLEVNVIQIKTIHLIKII